jgi:hypothetical protein
VNVDKCIHITDSEVVTAALLRLQVLWYVILCHRVSGFSHPEDHRALILKVISPQTDGLLDWEDEGNIILQNVIHY